MFFLNLFNIMKLKKWELLGLFIILISVKWFAIIPFKPNINHLTELHKCPACFGTSACNYIDEVDITPRDFFSAFAYFFGIKNVFIGTLKTDKVVLKRLAHSFELDEFDKMLCENKNFSNLCPTNFKKIEHETDIDFYELVKKEVSKNFALDNYVRLRVCPNVKHLNNLLQNIYLKNKNVDSKIIDINMWTSTILNPEPLVLQILNSEENWPVPKYLGACGRIVVEEYVGLPLLAYYNEPWLLRAKIASNLLDAVYMITYRSNMFGFYLTDISADNIAVDSNNNIKFIDLENIIVVDKYIVPEERSTNWNQLQENTEKFYCSDCLVFSSGDICNHNISDHNYYALCKVILGLNMSDSILPGGFLHDIPPDILDQHPDIPYLIQQCSNPQAPYTRIAAGMQLKNLLDIITHE